MITQLDIFNVNKRILKRVAISLVILFLFDMVWFKFSTNIYKGKVQDKIRKIGAAVAWILIAYAISVQKPKSLKEAGMYGAFTGLIIYGVFNGTAHAITKNWDAKTSIYDTMWGITNCTATSMILFKLSRFYD